MATAESCSRPRSLISQRRAIMQRLRKSYRVIPLSGRRSDRRLAQNNCRLDVLKQFRSCSTPSSFSPLNKMMSSGAHRAASARRIPSAQSYMYKSETAKRKWDNKAQILSRSGLGAGKRVWRVQAIRSATADRRSGDCISTSVARIMHSHSQTLKSHALIGPHLSSVPNATRTRTEILRVHRRRQCKWIFSFT